MRMRQWGYVINYQSSPACTRARLYVLTSWRSSRPSLSASSSEASGVFFFWEVCDVVSCSAGSVISYCVPEQTDGLSAAVARLCVAQFDLFCSFFTNFSCSCIIKWWYGHSLLKNIHHYSLNTAEKITAENSIGDGYVIQIVPCNDGHISDTYNRF